MNLNLSKHIARSLGVKTSLEDFDVDVNIGTAEDTDENGAQLSPVTSAGTLTPEAEQVEIVEEQQELDETVEASEELEEDVETLESIKLTLEKSLSQGGLDSISCEMLNITMGRIFKKHGIDAQEVMPSMEDFGDNRYRATQISMEKVGHAFKSFGGAVKDILKEIWYQIKKAIFSIVQFFKGNVVKRAEKIKEKAELAKKNGLVAKEDKIKLYAAVKLENKGKIADTATLVKKLDSLVEMSKNYSAAYKDVADNGIEVMKTKDGKDSVVKTWGNLVDGKLIVALTKTGLPFLKKDKKEVAVDLYFGGKHVAFDHETGKIRLGTNAGYEGVSRKNGGESKMASVMTLDEIIQVADKAVEVAKFVENMYSIYNDKAVERKVGELQSEDIDKFNEENPDMKNQMLTSAQVQSIFKSFLVYGEKISSFISSTNKAMLDYAAQSIGAYGKPEKK